MMKFKTVGAGLPNVLMINSPEPGMATPGAINGELGSRKPLPKTSTPSRVKWMELGTVLSTARPSKL
ncbi:hypothetical protein [Bacillus cereus]|uniref:hypothetical protein n=1 Tax=Bacillus cereus TaxID=1396 RepID=UPI0015ECC10D|nr:hypothetical protein [Bacillus cereus]